MAANITFSLANFAAGYCWPGPQQYATDLVALITGSLAGSFTGVVMGASLPAVEDQDKVWVRLDSNGYLEGIYKYQGVWARPHPIAPSANQRILWVGTTAQLWAFDGGSGEDPASVTPTATTGAMWEVDTAFAFRFPLGAGSSPYAGSTTVATVADPTSTGGAEKLAIPLTDGTDSYFEHTHLFGRMQSPTNDDQILTTGTPTTTAGAGVEQNGPGSRGDATNVTGGTGEYLVTGPADWEGGITETDPVSIMPPWKCVYFAKRTARTHITVTA